MTDTEPIDVRHLGRENVICCWRVGEIIIDPGPTSSLDVLLTALGDRQPAALLLTHIHLDHAGATGNLLRKWPDLTVYVHERGARHLADPSKLLASAERLYGERMEELWGEVAPVPEHRIRALSGGEAIEGFEVIYTPGHASHHVTYLHRETGVAFPGDTCGIRIPPGDFVLAPTPPPDIDLEAWEQSLHQIETRRPTALAITHFGRVDDVDAQIEGLRRSLRLNRDRVERYGLDRFIELIHEDLASAGVDGLSETVDQAAPLADIYAGLERYVRKRAEAETGA